MQVKANSVKMMDGVSLFFQMVLRAYGSEIANEQQETVCAASICFYLHPCHVNHSTHRDVFLLHSSQHCSMKVPEIYFLPHNSIEHIVSAD